MAKDHNAVAHARADIDAVEYEARAQIDRARHRARLRVLERALTELDNTGELVCIDDDRLVGMLIRIRSVVAKLEAEGIAADDETPSRIERRILAERGHSSTVVGEIFAPDDPCRDNVERAARRDRSDYDERVATELEALRGLLDGVAMHADASAIVREHNERRIDELSAIGGALAQRRRRHRGR